MEGVKKRVRDEPEVGSTAADRPETEKRLRYDVFDTLEDDFWVSDMPAVGDLATVMESFEREIGVADDGVEAVDELGDLSTAEIGWLLEASDDELGLPPSTSGQGHEADLKLEIPLHAEVETVGAGCGFEPWEVGCGGGDGGGAECLVFDELLDYGDVGFGFGGYS
uniref:Uncharacterized protein n=1 Tax=Kalanchoe fedtschenkoi TaxID=63787 RepID=A0A7N0T5X4_KALFE